MAGFSQCIPFGDRASTGFMVIRKVKEKGGTIGYLVDGGKTYWRLEDARERAMELSGTKRYSRDDEYTVSRA